MKIKFPFDIHAIEQTGPNEVEIEIFQPSDKPLVDINFHPSLKISDRKADKIYAKVYHDILLASLKIS